MLTFNRRLHSYSAPYPISDLPGWTTLQLNEFYQTILTLRHKNLIKNPRRIASMKKHPKAAITKRIPRESLQKERVLTGTPTEGHRESFGMERYDQKEEDLMDLRCHIKPLQSEPLTQGSKSLKEVAMCTWSSFARVYCQTRINGGRTCLKYVIPGNGSAAGAGVLTIVVKGWSTTRLTVQLVISTQQFKEYLIRAFNLFPRRQLYPPGVARAKKIRKCR
ncbi:unnamed protein product [Nesidiocoris tenuis]|uniref:Uncharacterized protein n=1 Tax=Nesidiocoris tenuis TaxID=355587 RepID=A0A6H5GFV6_9HEMI|nr:unnamed protein product [Nesidiocoris tenuis]